MDKNPNACAACRIQRRKCTNDCVFAPHFPLDQTESFEITQLPMSERTDAVNSLVNDADALLRDPVNDIVGVVGHLQNKLNEANIQLDKSKKELFKCMGLEAMLPIFQSQPQAYFNPQSHDNPSSSSVVPHNVLTMLGTSMRNRPSGNPTNQTQQQIFDAKQYAAAVAADKELQDMLRAFELSMQQYQPAQQPQDQQQSLKAQQYAAAVAESEKQDLLRPFELNRQQQLLNDQQHMFEGQQYAAAPETIEQEQQDMFRAFELSMQHYQPAQLPQDQQQHFKAQQHAEAPQAAETEQQNMYGPFELNQQHHPAQQPRDQQPIFEAQHEYGAGEAAEREQPNFLWWNEHDLEDLYRFTIGSKTPTGFIDYMAEDEAGPSWAVGNFENLYHIHSKQMEQDQTQIFSPAQDTQVQQNVQQHQHQQNFDGEEDSSNIGPSR